MTKHFCMILTFGLIGAALYGQQDPQAKEILDAMGEKTEKYQTIHAAFSITSIDQQNNTESVRDGELYVKKEKYRLNFLETESYFNGKTLWSYIPDAGEVSITEPDPSDNFFFSNPARLFTGYEKDYKYLYLGKDPETKCHEIDLVPIELNRDYFKIKLLIDPASLQIKSAHYFGKEGNHYLLEITSFDTSKNLPDPFFVFDPSKYPGIEVIDMRF